MIEVWVSAFFRVDKADVSGECPELVIFNAGVLLFFFFVVISAGGMVIGVGGVSLIVLLILILILSPLLGSPLFGSWERRFSGSWDGTNDGMVWVDG